MPNTNYDTVLTTTLEQRSTTVQDNVTNNNAVYYKMAERGNIRPFTGGHKIIEPLSYAENTNAGWYSGADILTTGATDELTAPEFTIKQLAVPVVITGLDEIKNSGSAGVIDLVVSKVRVAEATMENRLDLGMYADGTGSGGKELTGLGAAVPITVTNTYGNINRALAVNAWWKSRVTDTNAAPAAATILGLVNTEMYALTRGRDMPDLVAMDDVTYGVFEGVLQTFLRFTTSKMAELGFQAVRYKNAEVVLTTGIGGAGTAATTFFLNTKYIHLRPFSGRNIAPIDGGQRPFNQDVRAKTLAWAGNLTCSGAKFHSRLIQS